MSALINWATTGQIFVESIAAGVVVVGAFALGARLVAAVQDGRSAGRSVVGTYAIAVFCFLVAGAAVAFGVYFTIDK